MPHIVSLAARTAYQAGSTDDVLIALIEFDHPTLEEPVRISSDPTVRLSIEPLAYGTLHQSGTYAFVLPSIVMPDSEEGQPPQAKLVLDNVSREMATLLQGINDPLEITIKTVMAKTPDNVEQIFRKLIGSRASGDAGQITLDIGRQPFLEASFPCHRMSKARFPGLHR